MQRRNCESPVNCVRMILKCSETISISLYERSVELLGRDRRMREIAPNAKRPPRMITFHPKRGTVLMCDFTTGFRQPEMVKKRHVVVVSPRYRRHTGLCLVVPFSTVAPHEIEDHHHIIRCGKYPFFDPVRDVWAKADMLTCVCFERLDRVLINGRYGSPSLDINRSKSNSACSLERLKP